MNNWRDRAFQGADFSSRKQDQQLNFEASIVKQLLSHSQQNAAQAKRELKQEDPNASLTLAWFQHRYPSFPARLGCEKIPYVFEVNIFVEMIAHPTKTKIWSAFARWCDESDVNPKSEIVGFAFDLSGVGTTIMHNYSRSDLILTDDAGKQEQKQGRFSRPIDGVMYSIEPFKAFVYSTGREWVT